MGPLYEYSSTDYKSDLSGFIFFQIRCGASAVRVDAFSLPKLKFKNNTGFIAFATEVCARDRD